MLGVEYLSVLLLESQEQHNWGYIRVALGVSSIVFALLAVLWHECAKFNTSKTPFAHKRETSANLRFHSHNGKD